MTFASAGFSCAMYSSARSPIARSSDSGEPFDASSIRVVASLQSRCGFDRWRMLFTQDGIPIYLPADNRIDFSRFMTSDIAQIQISKGFTSLIDGPGAMGGGINLVSRQATLPFEADMRLGTSFDQNGAFNGVLTDLFAGTRQGNWYVQASGSVNYQNHFRLPDDCGVIL